MPFIQIASRKINTDLISHVEQLEQTVRVWFSGGTSLDLHGEQAAAFWKSLKAENALIAGDRGSTAVLPKYTSSSASHPSHSHSPHGHSSHSHSGHGQSGHASHVKK